MVEEGAIMPLFSKNQKEDAMEKKADSRHIRQNFCERSHFFASQETTEKWLAENLDARNFKCRSVFYFLPWRKRMLLI